MIVVVAAGGSVVAFTQGSQRSQGPSHPAPTATAGTTSTAGPTTTATDTPTPAETAESAFRRLITDENAGQYGPAWDELVPLQQAFIPRATYVACQGHSAQGAQVSIDKVVGTVAETIAVPGTTTLLPSTTITVNVTVSLGGQARATTTTVHEFAVAGGWRWSFDQAQVDAYRAGTCPG